MAGLLQWLFRTWANVCVRATTTESQRQRQAQCVTRATCAVAPGYKIGRVLMLPTPHFSSPLPGCCLIPCSPLAALQVSSPTLLHDWKSQPAVRIDQRGQVPGSLAEVGCKCWRRVGAVAPFSSGLVKCGQLGGSLEKAASQSCVPCEHTMRW